MESGAHFKTEWGDQYNRNLQNGIKIDNNYFSRSFYQRKNLNVMKLEDYLTKKTVQTRFNNDAN